VRLIHSIIEYQARVFRGGITMRSITSRNHERLSGAESLRSIGRSSRSDQANASNNRRRVSTLSDIYARPDLFDMEYAGASDQDAQFVARLIGRVRPRRVLEMACGSGRVTFTLARALPKVEIAGVDSSIAMLGKAAAAHDAAESSVRTRVSFVKGDMRDWPGAGGAFRT
jgi:SAM-dependent methyltransferase